MLQAQTFSSRFNRHLERSYQQTDKQVVILLDKYDKPLVQTMGMYTHFSLLSAFVKKEMRSYWFGTGISTVLGQVPQTKAYE